MLDSSNDDKATNLELNLVQGTDFLLKKSYKDLVISNDLAKALSPEEIAKMVVEEFSFDEPMGIANCKVDQQFNPKPAFEVSLEEYEEWCHPWRYSLIVKLLGQKLGFKMLDSWIRRMWIKQDDVKILDLNENFFLIWFFHESDYNHALYERPWLMANHYLLVQRWRPFFKPIEKKVQKMAVWLCMPDLLAELYNKNFPWRAGSKLATRLKIDGLTSIHIQGADL